MGLSILGYVLEPVRVGGSNSAFTLTPNNLIADSGAFSAHYPSGSEPVSRTEYLVLVQTDGLLADADFGWTKNEVVQRFDYSGQDQRFKPLAGAPLEVVGVLGPDSNTTRLQVFVPVEVSPFAPFRVSVGTGSGQNFPAALVSAFGVPAAGTVEILSTTGELNWNPGDLTLYEGISVRFQRQQFYTEQESTGNIGVVESYSLLNPLPATGQFPLVRIGFRDWLVPVARPNDGALNPPGAIPAGFFEWSESTGLIVFSSLDVVSYPGRTVYYDGVLFGWKVALPRQFIGTVNLPGIVAGLPTEGGDLIFRVPGYQFPSFVRVPSFSSKGKAGRVEILPTGQVGFSLADQAKYGALPVEVIFGDLPVERGIDLRLFRSPVNLSGEGSTKDVTAFYPTVGATLADPVIGSPQVLLPAIPYESASLEVRVEQGTGSFVGVLPRLDVASPPAGVGYLLDFDERQLLYAQRKVNQLVTSTETSAVVALPDSLVRTSDVLLEREIAPGAGVYQPLVLGQDAFLEPSSGVVTYASSFDQTITSGLASTFSGTLLTDIGTDFIAAGVTAGDYLIITAGVAEGVYHIIARTNSTITTQETGVVAANVLYEVRRGAEIILNRYWREILPVDPVTKVERVHSLGVIQNDTLVGSYVGLSFPAAQTVTTTGDFLADGVVVGDTLRLVSGPDTNSSRRITSVESQSAEVASAFTSFVAANGQVVRRLSVDPTTISSLRIRLGTVFSTLVVVANDAAFTVVTPGVVQVSLTTGNLNFAVADVSSGLTVFSVTELTIGKEYRLNPGLGLIEFTDRFLSGDEAIITYRTVDQETGLPGPTIEERGAFLVRKEVTQPYPRPSVTNQVQFNPLGRTVATTPAPQVFRGGRPQSSTQVSVDLSSSTITFLENQGYMTDALPSGSQVQIDERIHVDYGVYEALGGEKTLSVLQPPMVSLTISISSGSDTFSIMGDQTSLFPTGYLLRLNTEAVYAIVSSVYDSSEDLTTVTVNSTFNSDFLNPVIYVSSRTVSLLDFQVEFSGYRPVPRGMNVVRIVGDKVASYPQGTLLVFSGFGYTHYYEVSGSQLDESGETVVTLSMNALQEYKAPSSALSRSFLPVVDQATTVATTSHIPITTEGYLIFRQVDGSPGVILVDTLEESGRVDFGTPLVPNEAVGVFYTGYQTVDAGSRLRATYTSVIAPNSINGLENQILRMDYTVLSPDTFFYRVETLTNFLSEVSQELEDEAKGSAPTAGPVVSNSSSPQLFEQGVESVYFEEGHLTNVDLVCRALLRFYNDAIHHLEDHLQSVDGRVVGEVDGRFRFDGLIDNPIRVSYAQVTNEIDDRLTTYTGKVVSLYQASVYSRLYPKFRKSLFGVTTAGDNTGAETGEPILDWGQASLDSLPAVTFRRYPRALTLKDALSGETTLYVDNAQGTLDLLRPAFTAGLKVRIIARDGTVLVADGAPLTVSAVLGSPERINLSALPVDVPAGSSVFMSTEDDTYQKSYRIGTDVGVNKDEGLLTFIKPYFPFDGSLSPLPIPTELTIQPPDSNETLQMNDVGIFNLDKAPKRFPALDGVATTDTGDQGLPIQSPSPEQEIQALLNEASLITDILSSTTFETVLNGVSVDLSGTVLTYTGPFPAPAPQVWDLVRFTTGLNAGAGFRRVSSVNVGLGTAVVDMPFPSSTAGESAIFTASVDVATGTATFPTATTLNDPTLSVAIEVGHTIVITLLASPNLGARHQVVKRLSVTQLEFSPALAVFPDPGSTYRVSNHLETYSNLPTNEVLRLVRVLSANDRLFVAEADSQILSVDRFYDGDIQTQGVLTDLVSSTGTVAGDTLTDPGADFIVAGVNTSHFVFIRTGLNRGFYSVVAVTGPTQLKVSSSFPLSGPVTYRAVSAFGLSLDALTDTVTPLFAAEDTLTLVTSWQTQITPIAVVLPSGTAFGTALQQADVLGRQVVNTNRLAYLSDPATGPSARFENVTGSRDRLYDMRFTWIDSRVNLESGVLYEISRSVERRNDNLVKTTQQLLRLISLSAL